MSQHMVITKGYFSVLKTLFIFFTESDQMVLDTLSGTGSDQMQLISGQEPLPGSVATVPSWARLDRVKIPGDPGTNLTSPVVRMVLRNPEVVDQPPRIPDILYNNPDAHLAVSDIPYNDREPHFDASSVHVDLPGQHNNMSPYPVVHRKGGPRRSNARANRPNHRESMRMDVDGQQGKAHVDLPGQHGNMSPYPVIHRVSGGPSRQGDSSRGDVHADMPGQQNNRSPHPILHRPGSDGHDHSQHESTEPIRPPSRRSFSALDAPMRFLPDLNQGFSYPPFLPPRMNDRMFMFDRGGMGYPPPYFPYMRPMRPLVPTMFRPPFPMGHGHIHTMAPYGHGFRHRVPLRIY